MIVMQKDNGEYLISLYGEQFRSLIVNALSYLDQHEPTWSLETPIDRRKYIHGLILAAKKGYK